MNQHGRSIHNDGTAYEGLHDIHFRIFDAETGGQLLWNELLPEDMVNGYYSSVLEANESSNPLDESIFSLYPLYLELTVDGGDTL